MASVVTLSSGERRVQFFGLDGKRRTLYCGKVSQRIAAEIAKHVDTILACAAAKVPLDVATAKWLAELPDSWYSKLVKAELVLPRQGQTEVPTVAEYAKGYLARRTDVKAATRLTIVQVVRNLSDYFGNRPIDSVTAGDAEDFKRWLATARHQRRKADIGLAPATIAKRIQTAAVIFRDAKRRKLITENPFDGVRLPKATNPDRQRYIPAEVIQQLLDVIPDAEFRLLLVLSRYLGLRVPSEAFSLTWDCVDWQRLRLRVPSPKTAVHGKTFRVVPILPEVRPHLEAVYEQASEGTTYILHRLRQRDSARKAQQGFWSSLNLRKLLTLYLERVGIPPWPKLWHNLRASAATDLAQRFPAYVCSEWLGHTEAIAKAHYLLTTETHFQAAINAAPKTTHNPTHQLLELGGSGSHGCQETPEFQGVSRDTEQKLGMTGLEQPPKLPRHSASHVTDNAKYNALNDDPMLAGLLEVWERLDLGGRKALLDAAREIAEVHG